MGGLQQGARSGCRAAWGATVLGCVAALAASPATAARLAPSSEPLAGSQFQGADGNQDDTAELLDWQGMRARGAVQHGPDPNERDSAFTGGSREGQPYRWGLTTEDGGVAPRQNNVLDTWAAVNQLGSDTFLYLGFARASSGGTTFLGFELNHDARLWDNGNALIPCRRNGDVQIAYEPQGSAVNVAIRRWTTRSTDLRSGCARTGEFGDAVGIAPGADAQGALNAAEIASRLPGFHDDTVPAEQFGEASLNLTELLDATFRGECLAFASFWMHSRSSDSPTSSMQDYVAPQPLSVRTCAASGTKFSDTNANGARDEGEPGLPGFLIWADYDDDGIHDEGAEPFSISDQHGDYVINDIRPPRGTTYMLREALAPNGRTPRALPASWICSFPHAGTSGGTDEATGGQFGCAWGPIDAASTPHARDRDFGNWFPARLTLRKELEPADDPGRFDLLLNDRTVLADAADGDRITVNVPPGTHVVSEQASAGTNAGDFRSTVECRRDASQRGGRRAGTVFEALRLVAGDVASCTFRNIRPGVPAVAIRKTGPVVATAGERLRYRFFVTNPGDVPFEAAAVEVSDPACARGPRLVRKRGASGPDGSPETLDPGDAWIYRCVRNTAAPPERCTVSRVDNRATVTATAGGTTVRDDDTISTILRCPPPPAPDPDEPDLPDVPGPPEVPGPPDVPGMPRPLDPPGPARPADPGLPGPVAPPGPRPPDAEAAGTAGVQFRRVPRGCIGPRLPRIDLTGTRIAQVRILTDGRFVRTITPSILQRRVRPRVTLSPGPHRIELRVSFQLGTGSPPVRLVRSVEICEPPARSPRFTG